MALTAAFVDAHISKWEQLLKSPYRPYREKWPSRLFHHAPLENVVGILRDGNLRSRLDPNNAREADIAGAGVIDARDHAHHSARLYFRPRTPTQYHIEGVRRAGECQYGKQAPMLVMLVFDARRVLLSEGVKFSDRNMQLSAAVPGDTEAYFSGIPFQKVFHEGGTGGDKSITDHRCAEVLATSPLPLDPCLQWIYCRTDGEKNTLLFLLGDQAEDWRRHIKISNDLLIFDRRFPFVEEITISRENVTFQLNPRFDQQDIAVKLKVWDRANKCVLNYDNPAMKARPAHPHVRWAIPCKLSDGCYHIEVELEGHLMFADDLAIGSVII